MRGTTNVPSAYVFLRRGNQIAFLMRSNTGYKDGTYNVPCGHVEPGESFSQAAIRETLEEAGVQIKPSQLNHVFTMQRNEGPDNCRVDVFFETREWSGEPHNAEPDKHSELAWFDASSLPFDKIIDFQAEALRQMANGQTYRELGWESAV